MKLPLNPADAVRTLWDAPRRALAAFLPRSTGVRKETRRNTPALAAQTWESRRAELRKCAERAAQATRASTRSDS
jgi:hypothetical protein